MIFGKKTSATNDPYLGTVTQGQLRQQYEDMRTMQNAAHSSTYISSSMLGKAVYTNSTTNWIEDDFGRMRALGMRLHVTDGDSLPFDSIHTSLTKEHVFVFVVANDEPVVLKDERGLFPSDTLITQLRLIQK